MTITTKSDGHALVAAVRATAANHKNCWETLVPNPLDLNLKAEKAAEAAYADMEKVKAVLREHICQAYRVSIDELSGLAIA